MMSAIKALLQEARDALWPHERMATSRKQSRYTYTDGPMLWLGQHIVRAMQDAGYPAKIVENYRPPERQAELKALGRSRAGPWESPHQYFEAVDIIHPAKGWNVSEKYWDALAASVEAVAEKFGVELEHGHYWRFRDSAHVELKDWRDFRDRVREAVVKEGQARRPTVDELAQRFDQVLPGVRQS